MNQGFWFLLSYLLAFLICLKVFPAVFGSIAIAFIFTVLIDVIAELLEKLKLKRALSVPLAATGFYGAIVYAFYSVFPIALAEGRKIFSFEFTLPDGKVSKILESVVTYINDNLETIILNVFSYLATNLPKLLTMTLLIIVASAYLNVVKKHLGKSLDKLFPASSLGEIRKFMKNSYKQIKRFSYGQLMTALFVGFATALLSLLFKIPHALFLGILAGITDLVPYMGVIVTAIPLFLLGFSAHGWWGLLFAFIILFSTNQLEMWVLAPRISQRQVHINWFTILISMFVFGYLYGIVGILITVPMLILIKNMWNTFVVPYLKTH